MQLHEKPLSLEAELESFARLMRSTSDPARSGQDLPVDFDVTAPHVVTLFEPDDGEQIIGQAMSLRGALRCLARHIHRDGEVSDEDDEDDEDDLTSVPLSRLEMDALEDAFGEMEIHTSLDDEVAYVGGILEEYPDLELVAGWSALPPVHDMGLGIYRSTATITRKAPGRVVQQAAPRALPAEPRPPTPPLAPPRTPAKWSIN